MKDRFSDEEWSRILSAHAGDQLVWGGCPWPAYDGESVWSTQADILQAAFILPTPDKFTEENVLHLFDRHYDPRWTPEELIAFVDSVPR